MDSTIRLNTKDLSPEALYVLGATNKKKKMDDLIPIDWAWIIQSMINTCEPQVKYFPFFKPLLRDQGNSISLAHLKKCRDRYYVEWGEANYFLKKYSEFVLPECVALCGFAPKSMDDRRPAFITETTKIILYSQSAGLLFEYDELTQLVRPLTPDDLAKIIEKHKHVAIRLIYAWASLAEIATQRREEYLASMRSLHVFCQSVISRIDVPSFDPKLMFTYVAGGE